MKNYKVVLLKGDGIGPEIVDEAVKVLDKVSGKHDFEIEYIECDIGGLAIEKCDTALPRQTIRECKRADAVLFGAVGGYKWDKMLKALRPEMSIIELRNDLDLYANLLPCRITNNIKDLSPLGKKIEEKEIDLLLVRDLVGGLKLRERSCIRKNGVCASYNSELYMEEEVARIARVAFEAAMSRRKRVLNVDKANVLESSRIWRTSVMSVSEDYKDVELTNMNVETCVNTIIRNPSQFDVILTSKLFGDILAEELRGISGNINIMPSASIGRNNFGLYEPIHGSAPDIEKKGIANPIGMILAASMMLRYSLRELQAADDIDSAVMEVMNEARTIDMAKEGKKIVFCSEMGNIIANKI